MGAGKTTYGRRLAKQLNLQFIDLDQYIEKKHKSSIPYIFDLVGELGFRLIEHRTLLEVLQKDNFVLSTGGGTPCFYDNINILSQNGISIYLKLLPKAIVTRLKNAKKKRPLVDNFSDEELISFVDVKMLEREEFYNKANVVVDGTNINTRILVDVIQNLTKK